MWPLEKAVSARRCCLGSIRALHGPPRGEALLPGTFSGQVAAQRAVSISASASGRGGSPGGHDVDGRLGYRRLDARGAAGLALPRLPAVTAAKSRFLVVHVVHPLHLLTARSTAESGPPRLAPRSPRQIRHSTSTPPGNNPNPYDLSIPAKLFVGSAKLRLQAPDRCGPCLSEWPFGAVPAGRMSRRPQRNMK